MKYDIFEKFKLQARIGAEFAAVYPKYHNLSKMLVKEKGNEIYDIVKAKLSSDNVNPLKMMVEDALKDGNFREDLPGEFIYKIISFLFANFDEIFCYEEDLDIANIIKNLDYYVDFIKNGLGR